MYLWFAETYNANIFSADWVENEAPKPIKVEGVVRLNMLK